MKICIYTVNLGDYDWKKGHAKQTLPCDFFCFTDTIVRNADCLPMQAKAFRMFPDEIEELKAYDLAVYIDGNVQVADKKFLESVVDCGSIGLSLHPYGNCAYEEIKASTNAKYDQKVLNKYFERYENAGLPRNFGLYWSGFIVHRLSSLEKGLMEAWWQEVNEFPSPFPQCQAALSYVLWKTSIKPTIYPVQYRTNKWFRIHEHKV